jgi:hypothetical protein
MLLVFFILAGNLIAAGILKNVVQNRFVTLNSKETQIWSLEDIEVNMFTGTLKVKQVIIRPDSTYFQSFLAGETPNDNLISLGVSNVMFRGINAYDIFVRKYLNLKQIHVQGLTVIVDKRAASGVVKSDSITRKDSTVQTLVVPGLKNIDLNEIIVDQLTFIRVDAEQNKPIDTYHGEKMEITGLSLDPTGVLKGLFEINRDNLAIHLEEQHINLSAANYAMYFDSMELLVKEGNLIFTGLQIKPTTDKFKLASSSDFKKDVIELDLPVLQVSGIRIDDALYRGLIAMDSIIIDSFSVTLNTDLSRPRKSNVVPDFPNQALRKMKLPLQIGKIHLKNGQFRYEEFEGSRATKDMTLKNLDIAIQNVHSGIIEDSGEASLQINVLGTALKDAAFRIELDFPYGDPAFGFRYTGHVGPFNMTNLNAALADTNLGISEGHVTDISYNMYCTPHQCNGNFTMTYEGFKVAIEKKKVQKENKKLSLLANTLIKSNNPHKGRLKSVKVKVERMYDRGLPPMLIGTIRNGAKQTLTP